MAEPTRDDEIRTIWKENRFFYQLLGGVALVAIGVWIGGLIYADQSEGYGMTIFTSVINVAATVFILDRLNKRRSMRLAEAELKQQLLDDAASERNEIAKNALHQIYRKNWLRGADGILQDARLEVAN